MKIVLLGTGGYHPNSRRHTACVLLPEIGLAFDAGTGAFGIRKHLASDRLDIFLSHVHLDHIFGLTSLIGLFKGDETEKITVHGEGEKLAAVREHLFSKFIFPIPPNFKLCPLEEEQADAISLRDGSKLTWFSLPGHPGGSLGYRIDWPQSLDSERGKSLAYVTDTVASSREEYIEAIRGVSLLIHEAYFNDDQRELANLTGHSCLSDVADLAAEAEVGRLVLVHANPRSDAEVPLDISAASEKFANIGFAADGDEIDL